MASAVSLLAASASALVTERYRVTDVRGTARTFYGPYAELTESLLNGRFVKYDGSLTVVAVEHVVSIEDLSV
jgi:hypothetical protein